MTTKVITKENKFIGDPYDVQIIDAVHNGFDSVEIDGKVISVVSVYSTDEAKFIVIEVAR